MRLVIDDFKSEHYNLLAEMAKALNFKLSEVNLSDEEEDAYLLAHMGNTGDNTVATPEEVEDMKTWLRTSNSIL